MRVRRPDAEPRTVTRSDENCLREEAPVGHKATAVLILCCALVAIHSGYAQQPQMVSPDEFRLSLPSPPGWTQYAGPKSPDRFAGQLLKAWEKETESGKAIIYVLGTRRYGQFLFDHIADAFAEFLADVGVGAERFGNFYVLSRPAVKFTMSGAGTGQMIAALSERVAGDEPTYMEVVLTTNMWQGDQGTDFIQFVLGCPEGAQEEGVAALKAAVHKSMLLGRHTPTPEQLAAGEAADAEVVEGLEGEETVEIEEIVPMPLPPGETAAAEPVEPPTAPPPTARATRAAPVRANTLAAGGLFGSLYDSEAVVPRPIAVQFLTGLRQGANVRWQAPKDDRTDVYVCIWSEMRAAWILPGDAFRRLAREVDGGYELRYGGALAPYLGEWGNLWGTSTAP